MQQNTNSNKEGVLLCYFLFRTFTILHLPPCYFQLAHPNYLDLLISSYSEYIIVMEPKIIYSLFCKSHDIFPFALRPQRTDLQTLE
jgi:hypothetical protein